MFNRMRDQITAILANAPDQELGLATQEIAQRFRSPASLYRVFTALDELEKNGVVEVRAEGTPFPSTGTASGAWVPYRTTHSGPFYYRLAAEAGQAYAAQQAARPRRKRIRLRPPKPESGGEKLPWCRRTTARSRTCWPGAALLLAAYGQGRGRACTTTGSAGGNAPYLASPSQTSPRPQLTKRRKARWCTTKCGAPPGYNKLNDLIPARLLSAARHRPRSCSPHRPQWFPFPAACQRAF